VIGYDLLWLTTDPNPGGAATDYCARLKINLPRNDGKLKRGTIVKMKGEDGIVHNFLADAKPTKDAPITKEQHDNMLRYWWVYYGIIPEEWVEAVDFMEQLPWWWYDDTSTNKKS
jgi:hypothetical protein